MNIRQKQAIEAYQRVQDFVGQHPLPAAKGYGKGRTLLDGVVERLRNHTTLQAHGGRQAQLETRRQKEFKRQLRELHLRPIAVIAKAVLQEVPGIDVALRIPNARLPITQLLTAARAIREAVVAHEAVFVEIGRPADFLVQLDAAIARLEGSVTGRARHVGKRAGARVGIGDDIRRGRDAVEMLDTVVTTTFADDPDVLGAWRAARRVQAVPGGKAVGSDDGDAASVAA